MIRRLGHRIVGRWGRVSLRGKGLAVVAIPLIPLIGLIILVAIPIVRPQASNADALIAHTFEVRAAISDITIQLLDAEIAVRGYGLSGQESSLEPYREAQATLPADLARLEQLVQDNPAQVARVKQIEALSDQRLAELDVVRAGTRPRGQVLIESKPTADALDVQLDAMQAEETRLLAERQANALTQQRRGLIIFGAILSAVVLCGVLATLLFTSSVVHRVQSLAANADRLAAGEAVLPLTGGADEIGWLGRRLEEAADLLAARQRELREANALLEQRVQERTADLQEQADILQVQADALAHQAADLAATNLALAQKNDENEMFVYSVSHDLRSPLVNLQGFSQELTMVGQDLRALLTADGVPPATARQGLELIDQDMTTAVRFIQAGVARLSTIIDALLRLSRAGRVEYRWQVVEVQALVARIIDSLHETVTGRGASVTVAALPPAWGDAAALEQLFANLISNALAYLAPGRPGQIEVGCLPPAVGDPGDEASLTRIYYVRDNGLGIPDHAQAKIFQIFQRAHPDAVPGEGLGLALVNRIVERHHGTIRVESTEGAGSTFFVELPWQAERVSGDVDRAVSHSAR
jgi:signal transduction histidine kinase